METVSFCASTSLSECAPNAPSATASNPATAATRIIALEFFIGNLFDHVGPAMQRPRQIFIHRRLFPRGVPDVAQQLPGLHQLSFDERLALHSLFIGAGQFL